MLQKIYNAALLILLNYTLITTEKRARRRG